MQFYGYVMHAIAINLSTQNMMLIVFWYFFLHDVEKLWSQSHIFSYTNVKKRKIYVLQKLITLVLEKYCKFQCRNWLNWFSCTNHKICIINYFSVKVTQAYIIVFDPYQSWTILTSLTSSSSAQSELKYWKSAI